MTSAEEAFRRLAIGDQRMVASVCALDHEGPGLRHLDARVRALLRIGTLIALDAPPSSFRVEVDAAQRAGARLDDLLAVLVAAADLVGSARVVAAAPLIALAAGYDVDAALEAVDLDRV
jgi:alkylhydroperoxidase/carboxymuconolactone decarboxylase family protein YurZ